MGPNNITNLKKPFALEDIDWRIGRSGIKNGKPWAMVLAYLSASAVQERLDDVFGVLGWQSEYTESESGIFGTLIVWDGNEWIKKSDGALKTDFEALKDGISGDFNSAE